MARILFLDPEAAGLPFALRAQDEDAEVLIYCQDLKHKRVGENLVPHTESAVYAFAWAKEKPTVVVVTGSGTDRKGRNVAISADEYRRAGIHAIGGGQFCDRLENDRIFGENIAKAAGCRIPPTKTFLNIGQAIAFASTVGDEGWYFKTDKYLESDATYGAKNSDDMMRYLESVQKKFGDKIPCMLQQKIPGVALSTACWWNGKAFIPPYESTIEHKKMMNEELGPSTGCAFNVVWFTQNPKSAKSLRWDNFAPIFLKHKAPPGIYDVNAIISEEPGPWGPAGEAYFLEWTPRFGFDAEPTAARLLTIPLVEFYQKLVEGRLEEAPFSTDEIAYSIRLSVPPYPFEHHDEDKHSALGTPVEGADGLWEGHFIPYSVGLSDEGQLQVSDRWGLVGLALATGTKLSALSKAVISYAKDELRVPGLGFRTDGCERIQEDAKRIKRQGFDVPDAVLE